ncbi:MAG: amino acid adenylation domain-containing protein, partial [Blastocatellia bacterium]|nr:amino acid adenylation domain-containing protein [Blastocatellia bacterium]
DSIGCYAKYLPLFCTIEEESEFWSFLQKVELEIERLLEWQDYFEYTDNKTEISFEFNQIPSLASNNQTSFNIYRLEPFRESFKLRLFATETEDKLLIRLDYDSSKFTSEAIEILLEEFDTLLARLALRPKDNLRKVDFLGEKERKKLLLDFNSTSVDYDCEQLVDILIEEQAKLAPDKIAVVFEDQKLTYRELNEKAEDIAFLLEGLGVRNNLLVGVYAERSPEIVTAILAILKAGGGYVPLNTAYPKDRLSFILEDSGVKIVLTQKKLLADLPESQIQYICLDSNISKRTRDTVIKRGSEDIAYVIYTSGSTGQPKGVMVTHRNLVHSTKARFSYYKEPIINFLLVSPFAFDSSVAGLFWTLCQGATLTIPSEKFQQDMERFILLFTQNSISHMLCLPSLYSAIMEISSPRQLMTLKTIIVAGEACPKRLVERHLELFPEIDLFNEYGPTEATVWSTVYKCSDEDMFQIPIGAPIPNVKVYVLDSDRELLPLGMAGELCIGGKGVAKGYLNRELLTQEKFIPDPFSNQLSDKIYKTGDLVKFRLDGNIDFLGRVDNQVKIRGFRIELEEIEEAIKEHAAVEQTCVVVKEDESSEKSLVAFISPSNQNAFTVGQVITLEKEKVKIRYLPNDLPIIEQNRSETDFLYKTIFEEKDYLKHGIEIRDGDTIFDIGANIGMFTIFANQQAENIKIFAFEPIPAIFEVLRLNSQLYSPNIKPLNLGVSKSIDSTTFTYYP